MTAVKDLPVSWAKRLADLSNWSSSRIVVRMRQSVLDRHQYVKPSDSDFHRFVHFMQRGFCHF